MSARRLQVAAVMKLTESMLRGTLTPLYRRCGTPTCYCASGEERHGPIYSLNWSENGQPRRLYVPPELVDQVRQGVEAYRQYRDVGQQLAEENARALGLRAPRGKQRRR